MAYKFDSDNYRAKYLKLRRAVGFLLDQLDKGQATRENLTGLRTIYDEEYSDRIASISTLINLTKNHNAELKEMNLDQLAIARKMWVDLAVSEQLFDRFAPAVAIYGTNTEDWHRTLERGDIRADAEYRYSPERPGGIEVEILHIFCSGKLVFRASTGRRNEGWLFIPGNWVNTMLEASTAAAEYVRNEKDAAEAAEAAELRALLSLPEGK